MASARTENFDYDIRYGSLDIIDGPEEEVKGQVFELNTNAGEWFLGTDFGYPWIVKNKNQDNVGLLGTAFNEEYTSSIIAEKLLQSNAVKSVESISLNFSGGILSGQIVQYVRENEDNTISESPTTTKFIFGGVQK